MAREIGHGPGEASDEGSLSGNGGGA
jgi:hypothetical protein